MTEGEALSIAERVRFDTGPSPIDLNTAIIALRAYIAKLDSSRPRLMAQRDQLTAILDTSAPVLTLAREAYITLTVEPSDDPDDGGEGRN